VSIFWQGKQWRVTDRGVDEVTNNQPYWIEVESLAQGIAADERGQYPESWPSLMATKPWVDLDEFITAFLIACVGHGVHIEAIGEIIADAKRRRPL